MGNCFTIPKKKSSAEIAPSDYIRIPPVVRLYGSPDGIQTCYIRIALLYKTVSLHFIPSETPDVGSDAPVLQFGSDIISGSAETLLRYIEAKFPNPSFFDRVGSGSGSGFGSSGRNRRELAIVTAAKLQHKSLTWHVERVVNWAEDLEARGGGRTVDLSMGSPRMEMKKFGRSYSQLLEMLLEHAQMEERIIFPILERADRGLSKAANEDHSRDLPIMNGIKEDIKSIGVLETGSHVLQEALSKLYIRLKTLQEHCTEHFKEEENELLPLLEAAEMNKEEQERVVEQCFEVMEGTHSHLFQFLIEGLLPRDAMQYLDIIITRCSNKEQVSSMLLALTSRMEGSVSSIQDPCKG